MNHASPVAGRPPESRLATRAASGWYAAMPSPDTTIMASRIAYPDAVPLTAMATEPSPTPP